MKKVEKIFFKYILSLYLYFFKGSLFMLSKNQFIEFQEKIGYLKHLRRTGWVVRGIPSAETVGSHSWRMAVMALQKEKEISQAGANTDHVIKMCLLHDVGEAVIGDILPEKYQFSKSKITREEKNEREKHAIYQMAEMYNFPALKSFYDEYEEQETLESQIVFNLDRLDLVLQSYEYMTMFPKNTRLNELMREEGSVVNLPMFASEMAELKRRQFEGKYQKDNFLDFQILCGKLKSLERSGPKMYGIKDCETVASHCFRTAVMALQLSDLITKKGCSPAEVIRIALVHDLGEAVIGDIVPEKWQKGQKITKEEKHKREVQAIKTIANNFDMPFVWRAFDDLEGRKTLAALMAKDLEIFESIQQAYEYIKIYPEKAILREYIPYHKPRIKSDFISVIIKGVQRKQNDFLISKHFPTFYKEDSRS